MATELGPRGIVERSFQRYLSNRRFKPRLHSVYRWSGFDGAVTRSMVLCVLAGLRQAGVRYDWRGAFTRSKIFRRLFPWVEESEEREYCSENVVKVLIDNGWAKYPAGWDGNEPHPYPLWLSVSTDSSFEMVYEA